MQLNQPSMVAAFSCLARAGAGVPMGLRGWFGGSWLPRSEALRRAVFVVLKGCSSNLLRTLVYFVSFVLAIAAFKMWE